jgi:hypothetical protein
MTMTLAAALLGSGSVKAQTDPATATASSSGPSTGQLDVPNRAPSRSEQSLLDINGLILQLEGSQLLDQQRQFETNQRAFGAGRSTTGSSGTQ